MDTISAITKANKGMAILTRCEGTNGVWADPTRYSFQCWTRDFVIAIMPLLLAGDKTDIVKTHLANLSRRQRANGQIPILFLDKTTPFLLDKIGKSIRAKKLSFMLKRFLAGRLWDLTPGTRDSEILYIIGMIEYANATGDRSLLKTHAARLEKARDYIERHLMKNGLVVGCDWRDTMERELGDVPLLTNNALMFRAYRLLGEENKAQRLREAIETHLWNGETYLDYPGANRFDPLGGAFAVLHDVVPPEKYKQMVAGFASTDTPHGVTIKCRHNPLTHEEREVIERTDGEVVWPFIVGFSILALLKMGSREFAMDQFEKMTRLEGFREWYDPATGNGYGAQEQLWSATLYIRSLIAIDT